MMRVVAGGTLEQGEARRMVTEKSAAFAEAQATAVLAVVKGRKDTVIAGKPCVFLIPIRLMISRS
jgi:hypothetical protein